MSEDIITFKDFGAGVEKFQPFSDVPEDKNPGWEVWVNGEKVEDLKSVIGFRPGVGYFGFGWNGRFGQPFLCQNTGRLTIYICDHPQHGLLMGSSEEPRLLANGAMSTPTGGFDPDANNATLQEIFNMADGPEKTAALEQYGKQQAARENLEESGLDVTDLHQAGKFTSNRAFFIVDVTDEQLWNGEVPYICFVDPDLIGDNLTIQLPEDKLGDVMPAPEWSSISKLTFQTYIDCLATSDGVAIAAFSKAYRWWVLQKKI